MLFPQFGIVIDAGSTHTQVNLFAWPALKINGTGAISQVATIKCNGMSKYVCVIMLQIIREIDNVGNIIY